MARLSLVQTPAGSAFGTVQLLAVVRPALQGWFTTVMPSSRAVLLTWLVLGTLVALTLLPLAADRRASRRGAPSRT
jgi:hypothetical protein